MRATSEARDIIYKFVAGRQLVSESEVDNVRVRVHHHPIEDILLMDRVSAGVFFVVGLGARGV